MIEDLEGKIRQMSFFLRLNLCMSSFCFGWVLCEIIKRMMK
jgi:hypothetical protein